MEDEEITKEAEQLFKNQLESLDTYKEFWNDEKMKKDGEKAALELLKTLMDDLFQKSQNCLILVSDLAMRFNNIVKGEVLKAKNRRERIKKKMKEKSENLCNGFKLYLEGGVTGRALEHMKTTTIATFISGCKKTVPKEFREEQQAELEKKLEELQRQLSSSGGEVVAISDDDDDDDGDAIARFAPVPVIKQEPDDNDHDHDDDGTEVLEVLSKDGTRSEGTATELEMSSQGDENEMEEVRSRNRFSEREGDAREGINILSDEGHSHNHNLEGRKDAADDTHHHDKRTGNDKSMTSWTPADSVKASSIKDNRQAEIRRTNTNTDTEQTCSSALAASVTESQGQDQEEGNQSVSNPPTLTSLKQEYSEDDEIDEEEKQQNVSTSTVEMTTLKTEKDSIVIGRRPRRKLKGKKRPPSPSPSPPPPSSSSDSDSEYDRNSEDSDDGGEDDESESKEDSLCSIYSEHESKSASDEDSDVEYIPPAKMAKKSGNAEAGEGRKKKKTLGENIIVITTEGGTEYKCKVCTRQFKSKPNISNHENCGKNYDQLPFQCEKCEKRFKSDKRLKYHKKSGSCGKVYRCEPCNKTFSNHMLLRRHKCDAPAPARNENQEVRTSEMIKMIDKEIFEML